MTLYNLPNIVSNETGLSGARSVNNQRFPVNLPSIVVAGHFLFLFFAFIQTQTYSWCGSICLSFVNCFNGINKDMKRESSWLDSLRSLDKGACLILIGTTCNSNEDTFTLSRWNVVQSGPFVNEVYKMTKSKFSSPLLSPWRNLMLPTQGDERPCLQPCICVVLYHDRQLLLIAPPSA